MATWKKLIVSGSSAELAAVTASSGILVGSNQQIQSSVSNTRLSGSFSGSFAGDGSNLTNVTATATFPTNEITDLSNTDKFFTSNGTNSFTTYGNLLTDLAGSGLIVDGSDSLSVNSGSMLAYYTGSTFSTVSGDITISSNGVATIAANSVALGTDTTGNYVATVTGSGAIVSSVTTGEGSTPEITLNTTSTTFTNGVVSALPTGTVSGSSFSSPSQGTVRATINGVQTDVDTGLQTGDSPQFVDVTLTGDITVGGNDIKMNGGTTALTFSGTGDVAVAGDLTVTGNDIKSSTNTVFTLSGQDATVAGNMTVQGDLTVNGSLTNLNVANVNVEDQMILLASGSATGLDAGIIASSGSLGVGSAIYHDITDHRWSVAKAVASNATSITPLEYVTTVKLASGTPATQEYGKGEMYINTDDDSVWIYS